MKKKIIIPALLVIAAAVAGIFYFKNHQTPDVNRIRVSGNIEITDVEVSFKIPGRVEERPVFEGQMITVGQLVARLDDKDLKLEIAQRRAQVAAARSVLAEAQTGSRPEEIAQAEAVLERVQADGSRTRVEFERQKRLYEREVISTREFDQAKTAFEGTEARIREAKQALTLVRKGPTAGKNRSGPRGPGAGRTSPGTGGDQDELCHPHLSHFRDGPFRKRSTGRICFPRNSGYFYG